MSQRIDSSRFFSFPHEKNISERLASFPRMAIISRCRKTSLKRRGDIRRTARIFLAFLLFLLQTIPWRLGKPCLTDDFSVSDQPVERE